MPLKVTTNETALQGILPLHHDDMEALTQAGAA